MALLVAFVIPFLGGSAQGSSSLLSDLGFTPLAGGEAPVFSLPNLNDETVRLDQFRGKWKAVVFWATWCGACAQEMPILETLHQKFKMKGLEIIAVSGDEGPSDPIKAYAAERGLTFTILHDHTGKVTVQYRASSIPTTYLISPSGRLKGLARGAVPWNTAEALERWQQLLSAKEDEPLADHTAAAMPPDRINLPDDLAPPQMRLKALPEPVRVGRVYPLDLAITWPGDASRYLIKVPKVTLPDGVKLVTITSSTDSVAGQATLNYRFHLAVAEAGKYAIGPFELAFQNRSGGSEQYTRLGESEIEVIQPFYRRWQLAGLALLASLVIGAGGLHLVGRTPWVKRRETTSVDMGHELIARAEALAPMRMTGDARAYAVALIELSSAIRQLTGESSDGLAAKLEELKFGGLAMNDAELRVYEREIENWVKQRESDQ